MVLALLAAAAPGPCEAVKGPAGTAARLRSAAALERL